MNGKPVAVITGASRGIGRAITLALAAEGYDIVAIARSLDSEGMETLGPEVEKRNSDFFPIGLDISCTACQVEVVKDILDRYGRIDILVNNAGVAPLQRTDLLELSEESYDRVMNINLRGPLFFTQRVAKEMLWLKTMIETYSPKIIFISSVSAYMPSIRRAEYCISKAGLSMTTEVFAERLTREGILVYEIRPGIIETDMTARVKDKYDKMIEEGRIPQKRWGLPADVAKAVASIARGDWDFSSGAVFEVSGGLNIRSL
ncbi:MAG TPA: 3-ketoacyl-ACP reductase [Bacteroidales bacterium]|nr:3-ketoacyl-ACP reductase [Bacteroidales bacterium]HRR92375.1 3-ketoacyl-ACP reductase [Bacteroidales bacterium]HRT89458.1 3-ketoacyl-ACP reductase [Bacteroidales bacterium]